MSKDWTPEEIQAASKAMKEAGQPSYEEFCEQLDSIGNIPTIRSNAENNDNKHE